MCSKEKGYEYLVTHIYGLNSTMKNYKVKLLFLTFGIYLTFAQDIYGEGIDSSLLPWLNVCPKVHSYPCPSTLQPGKELLCISKDWLCDLDPDCPEGEDEDTKPGGPCHGKSTSTCTDSEQFLCKSDSTCIPVEWLCDDEQDCSDGSDEDKDNCPHVHNLIPCLPNQFQCEKTFKCIPFSKLCDQNEDCDSGLDETGCNNQNCKDFSSTCDKCVEVPEEGAKCDCGEGKMWNTTTNTCIDLDECKYEQICDQRFQCANSDPGFTCDCVAGYEKHEKTSCKAVNVPADSPTILLVTDEWNLHTRTSDGIKDIRSDVGQILAMDFHHRQNSLYWISKNNSNGRAAMFYGHPENLHGEFQKLPVNLQLSTVDSFAIDWLTDNIYFTDTVLKRVSVCLPNGKHCRIIVGGDNSQFQLIGPHAIVLDPADGYMYISEYSSAAGRIVRCDMDGSDCSEFLSVRIKLPSGLAIDYTNKHLYWSDMQYRVVERIDLSGDNTTRRLIASGLKVEHVKCLDIFENYLYLGDRAHNRVVRIHRYDYGAPLEVIYEQLNRPAQIHVYHRQRQPDGPDLCTPGICSDIRHICTVGRTEGGELKAECLCPAGFTKSSEGNCEALPQCADVCVGNCTSTVATSDPLPSNCTLAVCPSDMSYCSQSGVCIPSKWWCDNEPNCPNEEDEGIMCKKDTCLISEFKCRNGLCIDIDLQCNTINDCGDNSDETSCGICARENMFPCKEDNQTCIPMSFVCDGAWDCLGGSDESADTCGKEITCPDTDYKCDNGQCIPNAWTCDLDKDCEDGSDEGRNCDEGPGPNKCQEDERQCATQDRRCIPKGWFCDLEPDCPDLSDESDAVCKDSNHSCVSPNRLCAKDGAHICLKPSQLCDGVKDCDKGVDEGGACTAKSCNMKPCSDICYNTPDGYVCACPPGQKLGTDNHTCIVAVPVTDLCNQWGICGQSCELDLEAVHGYRCTCLDGFFLEPDKFTCKPLESDPVYVVFSNRHELRRVDIVSSNTVTLKSGLRNTIALDFYYKDGLANLYWTDVMEDKIYKGKMMGNSLTDIEAIITSGLATTEGVAFDWVGENIYWVESNLDQIEVAKFDGTGRTTLVAGNMSSPRAIVLDPTVGWLFWTDWDGHNPRIERSSMSGDYRSIIHTIKPAEGGGWPNGLTTDYDFRRLYWIDARSESIHTIKYDGSDHRLILKGNKFMSHPFALSLFGNYVYWTDWSTNSVVRANKFNGSDVQVIQKTITQPFDLQVIHPKRQPYMVNPCEVDNGGCSDLCLINVNQTVGCRCPHRKRLRADNKTCEDDIQFLLFVKDHEIRGVDFEKADFNVIPVITIPHVVNPTAIDYDVTSNTLYWADKGLNMIKKANFNANVETIIDKGLQNPEGFAIDWLSKNMYFSSYNTKIGKASISVATLAGSFRTEIINKNISQPNSIALHPLQGLLFYTDLEGEPKNHKLYQARMDGSELRVLLNDLDSPKSLSLDFDSNKLYFINGGDNTIISCDINGKNKQVISTNISKPEALTVYKQKLFVSGEGQIASVHMNGSGFMKLRDSTPNVKALLPYDVGSRSKSIPGETNSCHGSENKCSQLCLPTSQLLSKCKCTDGYDLDKDSATCVGITSFLLYAKETEIRGQKFNPQATLEALPPISNVQSASAVDFHAELDMIYWVDKKANTISRIKRDLTYREVVVRDGISSVEGLAIDWIAGHIYWTDAGHSTIEMSKLNGSNRYVVTSGDMEKPRSIVVDPELGYLYWSDWGIDARIERSKLDGTDRVHYVFTDIVRPWGLTIDYERHMLYWCDNEQQNIKCINLLTDRSQGLIQQTATFPISLTVFGDYIYWIDGKLNNGSIYRASKVDGGNVTLIRSELDGNLKDIKAFDKTRQIGDNLCAHDNGGCSELCFYQGDRNVKCGCSYGKLKADGKTCEGYKGFIMYSKVTGIDSVNLEQLDNMNPPVQHIINETYLRNVIGLAFDYATQRIFYSDIQRGDIQTVGFDGKNFQIIVNGIGSAEGLAYEYINGDLYWTSYTNSCISKINIEDALNNVTRQPEVVIQLSKMDHPRAIVVDSCWGLIYWTNWNNERARIQRSSLDGSDDENIIVEDILTPNGLTIDHIAKKLYWSDARLDKIERCDMDGSNRHILLTSIPQHSFGLAVYGDFLFWTDWMLRAIIKVNKYDGTGIVWLRKNLERQPMGIIAVAEDSNDCTLNACHGDNGGCQDKCVTDLEGNAMCQCHYGRLNPDGKSCAAMYNCSNVGYEAFSCLSGLCLPFQKSCDGVPDCPDGWDEHLQNCANRECPPSMFTCADRSAGQCIALSKKCDRVIDCRDGSDEVPAECDCPSSFFRCSDGNCIRKEFRCNGINECSDRSDEKDCPNDVKCPEDHVSCNSTSDCIPKDKICDGKEDCADGTDEPDSCVINCGANMFPCANKKECIYENWRCDKDVDCKDHSDEDNCDYKCKEHQFQCANSSHCISENWVCDMNDDCEDGSDELGCENLNCTGQFNCSSGRCISMDWVCDGEPDCHDGRDESIHAGCEPMECGPNEFQCSNYRCVDIDYYCDNHDDCGDNSDEPENCKPHPRQCLSSQFECQFSGICIEKSKTCDGSSDCQDGSDEWECGPCPNQFQCSNGVCINETLVCNFENDCGDHSDEPYMCGVNECDLKKPCSHKCEDKKIGYECSCYVGYKLRDDNKTCDDVNECETSHPCSHYCNNTLGSYFCTCAEHYVIGPDRRSCDLTSEEGRPFLLLSNRHYIRKMMINGSHEVLVANLTYSVAIDFDYQEQMLYWTDIHQQSSTINRIHLDNTKNSNSEKEVLHSSMVLNPDGLAVDWVGRNLYWCDRNTDTVEVSRLDGKYRKLLVRDKTFLHEPRALELFPKYGYLYISDWGDEPHISRISMDGKIKERIETDEVAWPNALTIDYVTEKIFWADANYDYIAMADLDGKNRKVIISEDLPHTFAITTFMNYIFWTDWESNGVYQAEKFSGEKRTLLAAMKLRPMDIVVYHSMRQPKLPENPCEALNCSHLCLLKPGTGNKTVEAICACPENHELNPDNRTCKDHCTSSQFLCESSSKCMPLWWKCDNHTDCEDGSDEPADCKPYHCRQPGLYQCKSAKNYEECIPPIAICDGEPQCTDGSDESEWNNCDDYTCMMHQFKCKADKKCISETKVCDGTNDCSDGADEKECKQQDCLDSQFTCKGSNKCIAYLWLCDGENDCHDWSDEQNCENRTCKENFMKCEKSQKCIPEQWECDGEHDCGADDDTDENQDRCSRVTCDPQSISCGNSHCIPARWKCDGDNDCSDGRDEKDCPPKNCTSAEFKCDNGNKCIPQSARCNGLNDCRDLTDEQDCPETECSKGYFQCESIPLCIQEAFVCDGYQQCMDGSDERNCTFQCAANEFKCKNSSECKSVQWRCDGDYDCEDKSDEEECHKYACQYGRFRCSNHICISLTSVCDGHKDCSTNEDESPALCYQTQCDNTQYRCKTSHKCIKMSQLCDGKTDCEGGDDENTNDVCREDNMASCRGWQTVCEKNCTLFTSLGKHKCSCPAGYILDTDETQCIVDDPCLKWKACPQKCTRLEHQQVHCSCEKGYQQYRLEDGATTCLAEGNKPRLLIAWETEIHEHKIHDNSTEAQNQVSTAPYLVESIDIDMSSKSQDDWLLFVVYGTRSLITKVSFKGSAISSISKTDLEKPVRNTREVGEEIIVSDTGRPRHIAVDWIGKHIYWTDTMDKSIRMSRFDGQRVKTILKYHVIDPFDIVVEPNLGKIFWTDHGYPPTIESAHLDGSNRTVLVGRSLLLPNGLAIDAPNDRLYFADTKKHRVETIRTDGSDRHVVKKFDASDPPYMVDVFEEVLYVSLAKSHRIVKIPKFFDAAKNNLTFLTDRSPPISNILIIQENKQQIIDFNRSNACGTNPKCMDTQVCVNNPAGQLDDLQRCMCPDGAVANEGRCDFKRCPEGYCSNGGNCSVLYTGELQCSCPRGFNDDRCTTDICLGYCFSGGSCKVSAEDPPKPECSCPPGYYGQRCTMFNCTGYCHNGGDCAIKNGLPICSCKFGYTGTHCEFHMGCDSYCENNGTCIIHRGMLLCVCPKEYTGARCEKCGSQHLTHYCANGGVCVMEGQAPRCHCKPGYDPQDNCQTLTCKNYCMNNAQCKLHSNRIECVCPAGYDGPQCNNTIQECRPDYCMNGGTCSNANAINHVQCLCPEGFYGSRCEGFLNKCYDFCKNGGNCTMAGGSSPYCTCPDMYSGPTCEKCSCINGQCTKDNFGKTYCKCNSPLFEGRFCNRSICHDWCYNEAECIGCHIKSNNVTYLGECLECKCKKHTSGPRCHILDKRPQVGQAGNSLLIPIVISIVLAVVILLAVVLFIIIRKKRGQFRHSRLKDGNNMQVANPIYMPQTTEDDEEEGDPSHQPLDQPYDFDPEKSTNFANPVYEQFFANDSRQQLLSQEDSDDDSQQKERR